MSTLEARIAEVLAGHQLVGISLHEDAHCTGSGCGWTPTSSFLFPTADHRAHVAQMLAPAIREAQAEALREAADLLAPKGILWWGDSGVRVSDGPFGMPQGSLDDWLRARADNLEAS